MGNGLIVLNREENGYKSLRGFRNLKNNLRWLLMNQMQIVKNWNVN